MGKVCAYNMHRVRTVLEDILNELGYATRQAVDADGALDLERTMGRLDLLIIDVGLPSSNGRRLAEIMRKRRPGLKVLLITGYDGLRLQPRPRVRCWTRAWTCWPSPSPSKPWPTRSRPCWTTQADPCDELT